MTNYALTQSSCSLFVSSSLPSGLFLGAPLTCLTVYRGHWCPFCQAYLKQLQSLQGRITAAGGSVFTVTAENQSELPKMREASGFTGETIVDTENLLVKELQRRGIIDVAISEKKGYPHGMAQPAVLVGGKNGLYYTWAIKPSVVSQFAIPSNG